ncbi:MAG: flavodoxin-dependent (E)-4-hydroxy-3-methylbut-2-enyl-diphosphate synthase [Oscillospiraceae bacterium]|jgi:(E)-4-hydroxy-3-methylbut-2-enyl-diphosphate synthase|nr:flavodoxin-dependent (E)-4-hydroxy-3-methylbut-2-enyl-diphosphate synthase [Oscillospiraceae bacterium]
MKTRRIMVGGIAIGGGAPISVQSMLCAPPGDVAANIAQAKALKDAGCDILRVAVPTRESVALIPAIKEAAGLPLVADIHFDYRLAIMAVEAGADKIRINPGNIGGDDHVGQVADACGKRGIPIRAGVNSGSLDKDILKAHGGPTPRALAESGLRQARLLERFGFKDIAVSLKSSDVANTVAAYRIIAREADYPLHIGVTEAGTERMGLIKSAIGIGALLLDGIGDTLRVSLTADPVREALAGRDILRTLGLAQGPNFVSCPTCGRCKIDLFSLAERVEERLGGLKENITVAVMGCAVNGPGEAAHADIGVAGGDGEGLLFAKGKIIGKAPYDSIPDELERMARDVIKDKS